MLSLLDRSPVRLLGNLVSPSHLRVLSSVSTHALDNRTLLWVAGPGTGNIRSHPRPCFLLYKRRLSSCPRCPELPLCLYNACLSCFSFGHSQIHDLSLVHDALGSGAVTAVMQRQEQNKQNPPRSVFLTSKGRYQE